MTHDPRTTRITLLAGVGLVIALVAGGVSVSRWTPRATPPSAPPPPGEAMTPAEAPAATPLPRDAGDESELEAQSFDATSVLSEEELARRRAIAARLRARIDEGRREVPSGTYGGLLGDAEPVPIYDEEGALLGIELRDVARNGFYDQLGLRDGDLVRAVNGISFDTPGVAAELLGSLVRSERVEIEIERSDGTPAVLSLAREQVFEAIATLDAGDPAP